MMLDSSISLSGDEIAFPIALRVLIGAEDAAKLGVCSETATLSDSAGLVRASTNLGLFPPPGELEDDLHCEVAGRLSV